MLLSEVNPLESDACFYTDWIAALAMPNGDRLTPYSGLSVSCFVHGSTASHLSYKSMLLLVECCTKIVVMRKRTLSSELIKQSQ